MIPIMGASFVFGANGLGFLLIVPGDLAVETRPRAGAGSARRFLRDSDDCDPLRALRPRDQGRPGAERVVLVFYFNYSGIDAGGRGLKELHLDPANLGYLFTSMGVGSVVGAVFVIPWARARFSPNTLTIYANLLLALNLFLMANVHRPHVFLLVAAIASRVDLVFHRTLDSRPTRDA